MLSLKNMQIGLLLWVIALSCACGDENVVIPSVDSGRSDSKLDFGIDIDTNDDSSSIIDHCKSTGTWMLNSSGIPEVNSAFRVSDLSKQKTDISIESVDGCGFKMKADGETYDVQCDVPNLTIPIEESKNYILDACETAWSFSGGSHSFITIRDASDKLVLAGGAGVDLIENVTCLPLEFSVALIDENCSVLEGQNLCGGRKNFGIRISYQSKEYDIWPGESAMITIDDIDYDVFNFYSFFAVDWGKACTDQANQYMSWAIIRR